MKICNNCGSEIKEGTIYCEACGTKVGKEKVSGVLMNGDVTPKNIAIALLLSILTCGLYSIYWYYCMQEDTNKLDGDFSVSGAIVLILTIITCGLYSLYWYYRLGKRLHEVRTARGMKSSDNSILYLIFGIVGLSIVSVCLIQDEINKLAE